MTEPMEQWVEELLKLNDEDDKLTDKQIRILHAAVEIFSEKGYSATSTSEIAQRAGVAEGTIFRHYKTKKDLLLSIVAPTLSKLITPFLLRDFTKVLDRKYARYEDFMRAMLANRVEFVKKNAPLVKILLQEIPFQPELQERIKTMFTEQVYERVRKAIERFQQEGQIVEMPTPSVIRLLVTSLFGYIAARYIFLPDLAWDDEAEMERTVRFVMHGLSAGKTGPE